MTDRIRVVVVDDHPLVLRGTCDTIAEAPDLEVVGRGENGDQALALAESLQPDVLVLDVHMPGRDGVSVVRELASRPGPR
ncbi:MAG TPA: response regulator transcription factor, partial [Oscillatoriaceae cyanobacterium]